MLGDVYVFSGFKHQIMGLSGEISLVFFCVFFCTPWIKLTMSNDNDGQSTQNNVDNPLSTSYGPDMVQGSSTHHVIWSSRCHHEMIITPFSEKKQLRLWESRAFPKVTQLEIAGSPQRVLHCCYFLPFWFRNLQKHSGSPSWRDTETHLSIP